MIIIRSNNFFRVDRFNDWSMKSIFTQRIQIQSLSLRILLRPCWSLFQLHLVVCAWQVSIHLSVPLVWRVLSPVVLLRSLTFYLMLLIAWPYKCQHPQLPQRWRWRSSGTVDWYCNGRKMDVIRHIYNESYIVHKINVIRFYHYYSLLHHFSIMSTLQWNHHWQCSQQRVVQNL